MKKYSLLTTMFVFAGAALFMTSCEDGPLTDVPSEVVEISEDITSDVTWTKETLYRVMNPVAVESGAKLTIEPGVVVEFVVDAGLTVASDNSVLISSGTEEEPILFTGEQEIAGYWRGINIFSNSVENTISHTQIHYAGSVSAGIYFEEAALTIDRAKVTLSNVSFIENDGYGIQTRRDDSDFSVENCYFENNSASSMLIHPEQINFIDNQTNFNGGDVEVYGGDTDDSGSEIWSSLNNGVYYFSGSVDIDNSVTIEPGAFFEMDTDVKLRVNDEIKAEGTSDNWIVFSGRSKAKGAWKGILVGSASVENVLDYVKIEYGGGADLDIYMDAGNLGVLGDAYLDAPNLKIENSAAYGIIVRETRDATFNGGNVEYAGNTDDNYYTY